MARTIKLSRIDSALRTLSYPTTRSTAAAELDDVTLLLADGEAELRDVIENVESEEFGSVGELRDSIYEQLPVEAIGEPNQSEGDA